MNFSMTIRSVLLRAMGAVVALCATLQHPVGAQNATFTACYVPQVGAMYLIKRTGLPNACLSTAHVEISWTEGGPLADGSVTTAKLSDGAVTMNKLAFDPATQVELDANKAELQSSGTVNATSNPVDWTKLKGVPTGFADGVDNTGGTSSDLDCVACVATVELADLAVTLAKIADGAVTTAKLSFDPATQAELDAHKAELQSAGTINATSNPVDWTKLKNVPVGLADGTDDDSGGDITGVTAGAGLSGGGLSGEVALTVAFGGPGSATTVARSDHTHALAGMWNTAVGQDALSSNAGSRNTAVGFSALVANTTGDFNTALGTHALGGNTVGVWNTAVGTGAMANNTANNNTAVGVQALFSNTTGEKNTAVGVGALLSSTGSGNIGIGYGVGSERGDNNIYIGSSGTAVVESNTIHIGTVGTQSQTFVAGIAGTAVSGSAVFVNSAGQLGIAVSTARAKEAVEDVGTASRRLLRLRPVQFRYKPEYDGSRQLQYGLIAEEVASVFPELVIYNSKGEVETVRYHLLPILLLNEFQRHEAELSTLRAALEAQAVALQELKASRNRGH